MAVKVKVCGLTRLEDVQATVDAGADAVGFIHGFPKSPRNLSEEQLGYLLRNSPTTVQRIVVTTVQPIKSLQTLAEKFQPEAFQLYGDLSALKGITSLPRLIGVYHVIDNMKPDLRGLENAESVLLDSKPGKTPGGTGTIHNWSVSRNVRDEIHPKPLILSGGLNLNNICEAVKIVKPYGVDASSGLESAPGVKDHRKIKEFVREAKKVDTES
ncbi:MAG: phosphoribosylanthranilate isomerase [Thaumarchaeota archaeon]|nr:phosphoribosylanthranilate isomerase [Nitrososphaerota archaeon]